MAPQPYNWAKEQSGIEYGATVAQRPHLAVMAMQVIATWSEIDRSLNDLLVKFIEADFERATYMLQGIESGALRRTLVRRMAERALPQADYQLFSAILATIKTSETRRNQYAHHIWGMSDSRPNDVLLADPKDLNMSHATFRDMMAGDMAKARELTKGTKWQIFTEQDFQEGIQDAKRAAHVLAEFTTILLWNTHLKQEADAKRATLSAERLIAKELERLKGKTP